MKYLLTNIALLFLQSSFACDCVMKPQIDIRDWNDTELIFKAELTEVFEFRFFKYLKFNILESYKGELTETTIHHKVANLKGHKDFHHIDTIYKGQEWIIFSYSIIKDQERTIKFKNPRDKKYCILSKPIVENDTYMSFVNKILEYKDSKNNTYNYQKTYATGSLENLTPVGRWKYYANMNMDHYWEGMYVNGYREGKWVEKAINYINEEVIISEEKYKRGILEEKTRYNYINEKQEQLFYREEGIKRIIYRNNSVSSIWIYDRSSNTSTIEYFKNGKSIEKKTKNGLIF